MAKTSGNVQWHRQWWTVKLTRTGLQYTLEKNSKITYGPPLAGPAIAIIHAVHVVFG